MTADAQAQQPEDVQAPQPEGIDVSNHNGAIDWPRVAAAGISFAYVKATEGTGFTDPYYTRNVDQARANQILVGAYHYFKPAIDAAQQARHFMEVVGGSRPGMLPPCLDVEELGGVSPARVVEAVRTWCSIVQPVFGRDVLIYTYPDFWIRQLGNPTDFAHTNPLWFARYASSPNPLPGGWQSQTIWQYTSTGQVPGISTVVDRDRFNGDMAALRRLADLRYFPQTRHWLGGGFRHKWVEYEALGKALECIGYPITDEMQETIGGRVYTVQYFERARFEWHTESGVGMVLFGLLGVEALARRGGGTEVTG
jgi:GH25 family lysozyme M1 (1,4-beta-N-acetylmuramidase)